MLNPSSYKGKLTKYNTKPVYYMLHGGTQGTMLGMGVQLDAALVVVTTTTAIIVVVLEEGG